MRIATVILVAAAIMPACTTRPAAAPPLEVRVPEYVSSESFAARMFHEYAEQSSRLQFRFIPTAGTSTVQMFARGGADIAATSADAAYFAFRDFSEGDDRNRFRAIAALQMVPMHLLVRKDRRITTIRDVHRVAFMNTTPVTNRVNERIARELGIQTAVAIPAAQFRDLDPLATSDFDAVLVSTDYPASTIQRRLDDGARLIDIDDDVIARLQKDYPFIRPMGIPAGTYKGQEAPLHTFGINMVLVCRKGVSDDVVYELTRHLFQVLAKLRHDYPELRRLELRQTLATPIPLHPGAATYYREMELGS